MTHEHFKQKHKVPVNCRENKQIVVEENHTSNTGPSAPRNDQETFASEEPTASSTTDENKENVCAGNLDLLVQDAVKDLLNIVHIVSINYILYRIWIYIDQIGEDEYCGQQEIKELEKSYFIVEKWSNTVDSQR